MSCGPRSRRVTPVSRLYRQEERKRNFRTSVALCCLDETRRFLLWTLPPTSVLHISNLSEIASRVPKICDFKNWLSFFVFFSSSCRTLTKTRTPNPISLKFGTQKGAIKAHLGTNFGWNTITGKEI